MQTSETAYDIVEYYGEMEDDTEDEVVEVPEVDNYNRIALPMLFVPESDPSWRLHAQCLNGDVDMFDGHNQAKAKAVCVGCPVIAECLNFALVNKEEHGVWGGLGPAERKRVG